VRRSARVNSLTSRPATLADRQHRRPL